MQKTKFGVSVNLVAMVIYLLAAGFLFSNNMLIYPLIVAVAYVLIREDKDLKAHALMASVLVLLYCTVDIILALVPGFLSFLNFFMQFGDITIADGWGIVNFLSLLIKWAFQAILITLAFMALKGKKIKLFDKFLG